MGPARTATVLSAVWSPVTGSAEPELAGGLGSDWQADATQLALAHGGRVAPVAAEATALVATFDAAPGSSDHAERALRCGLAWLAMAQERADSSRHRGVRVATRCRFGAHTGPVACDLGVQGVQCVQGDQGDQGDPGGTARAASCIADAAAPGQFCISQQVAPLVRGLFVVDPPLPLTLQGRPVALQTCVLRHAALHAPDAPGDGADEPPRAMVGRQTALACLQAALDRLVGDCPAAAVTVLADAGLGKSRLLREFEAWLQARPLPHHVLRGTATVQAQGQPFGLLGGLLRTFFQIDLDGAPQDVRARFDRAVRPWFLAHPDVLTAEYHAHALGHLIGVEFVDSPHLQGVLTGPKSIRQGAFRAAAQLLRHLGAAGGAPVLLLVEDLHWADADSLGFLAHLLKANHDTALLIVSTSRPALVDRRPA